MMRKSKIQISTIINYGALCVLGIITLYPFIYILVLSFNDGYDTLKGGIYFWPREITFENYIKVFQDSNILNAYGITIFRTVVGTLIGTIMCSMLAFALAFKNLPGRRFIVFFFFFTTIFSGGMIPYYILLRQLNLTQSIWVYVLPQLYNFFNIMLLRTYFETIPESIGESARIDGCGYSRVFVQMFLPLSKSVIATIMLFFGVAHWNEWFTGAYYVQNKDLFPVATLLQNILNEATFESATFDATKMNTGIATAITSTTPESLKMAFIMVMTLPILCVYPFLQKYFVKGIMLGSVKG